MSSRFLGKVLNAFSFHLQLARMFNSKHVSSTSVNDHGKYLPLPGFCSSNSTFYKSCIYFPFSLMLFINFNLSPL